MSQHSGIIENALHILRKSSYLLYTCLPYYGKSNVPKGGNKYSCPVVHFLFHTLTTGIF